MESGYGRWTEGPGAGGSCRSNTGLINAHCKSDSRQIGGSGSRTFFGGPRPHIPIASGCRVQAYVR